MATNKKWIVKFVAGNPEIFSKVRTDPSSPMTRSLALDAIGIVENHGWRGWVEDTDGQRIYETTVEKQFSHSHA